MPPPPPPPPPTPHDGRLEGDLKPARVPLRQLAVVIAVVATAIAVGRYRDARTAERYGESAFDGSQTERSGRRGELVSGTDTAPASAPLAGEATGAPQVRSLDGTLAPLVLPGQPTIVMISSRTCSWCKQALSDIGEMSKGRAVPRLTVLTLEGAEVGTPMLESERISGARLVGPAGSSGKVFLTFRYPGTPTFLAIDRNGRVVRTMPGYPGRQELQRWFAVMVGEQETP